MESSRETNQRYYSNNGGGGGVSNSRAADHLIRLQLRCQDVGTNEILPIVFPIDGCNKLQEQKRNIIAFQDQESNMNCRQNKTSKSHQRQQQQQPGSISTRQTSIQRGNQKSSKITSPTSNSISSGLGSPIQMQHLNSHHSTISINGNSHTFGSHRSATTDSSGFSSEASTTSCYSQPQAMHSLNINDYQQRESIPNENQTTRTNLIRSRLIEDLNRLEKIAAAAAKAQRNLQTNIQQISTEHCQTPVEGRVSTNSVSHMSPVSTLSRAAGINCAEIDYSTLCRDEFSSFIDYKNRTIDNNGRVDHEARASSLHSSQTLKSRETRRHKNGVSKQKCQTGGPMLVGVHECESPRNSNYIRSPSSFASSSSSPVSVEKELNFESTSSSGHNSLTKVDHFDEDNEDRELICHEIFDEDECLDEVGNHIQFGANLSRDGLSHCEVHVEENFSDDNSVDLIEDQLTAMDRYRPSPCKDLQLNLLSKNPDDQYKLSDMLDVYLSRVESLLRLVKGDKSVNLNDLVDGASSDKCAASQIDVREEFKTSIDYVPSSNYSKPEVIQEIEVVVFEGASNDMDEHEYVGADNNCTNLKTEKIITNFGSNFDALLSCPQTTAKLNWWPNQLSAVETEPDSLIDTERSDENNNKPTNVFIDQKQCRLLERSFLNRWLELCSLDIEEKISNCDSLVKTISKHMNEFVTNYNAYQESMCHETSFAQDWHENWLFSTSMRNRMPLKRAYQLSELYQESSPTLKVPTPEDDSLPANIDQQQQQQLNPKRAKLMRPSTVEVNELLNYSTLLINKYKPVKVTFMEELCEMKQQLNKYEQRIDALYEKQLDYLNELQQTALELSCQINVCHLLLNDSFTELECDDTTDEVGLNSKRLKRSLEVEYESSLNGGRSLIDGQLLCFRAHGYLFELRKLRFFEVLTANKRCKQKLDAFKRLILNRFCSSCHWNGLQRSSLNAASKLIRVSEELPQKQCQQDQVRFLVQISDIQVSQPLPVIQFCAKITGALPIRVGWYRLLDDDTQCDLTTIKQSATPQNDGTMMADDWPKTMWARHEFEYQNDWFSWYKFKRDQGDILFEIRNAHLEQDYGHTFKCVIENYCSIKECEFKLDLKRRKQDIKLSTPSSDANVVLRSRSRIERMKTRHNRREAAMVQTEDELGRIRLHKVEVVNDKQEAGQAILRTWSQRTLNKRAPLVDHDDQGCSEQQVDTGASLAASSDLQQSSLHGGCQQLQTVGRLSAQAMNDCKFGTNYPYHPVSLMRRLEENKMSLTLRSRLRLAGKQSSDGHKNMTATDNLTAGAILHEDDENTNKAARRFCWTPESNQQHYKYQANQESELSNSELFSSPLACPLAPPPPPTNRLEVRDCGELRGAGKQCATFMRPSHRQPTSNTISNDGQLLLFGNGCDQDSNHYHIVGEDQQKSNLDCDRERANHGRLDNEHAPKPKPRPRQKPAPVVGIVQGDDGLTGVAVGEPKRQPLSDVANLKGVHHAPVDEMRSSELQLKLSAGQSIDDGGRLNYDNYHASYDYQKSRASNNWMPTGSEVGNKQAQALPASLAVCDDLQTPQTSQPPSSPPTSTNSGESRTNQARQVHDDSTKQSGNPDRSSSGSSQAASRPAVAELETTKPKSVRSLISRFNMI